MTTTITLTDGATEDAPVPAEKPDDNTPLLEIKDLKISFTTANGVVDAVRGVDLTVYPGQSVAIVGESGSGTSTTAHAIIDLLPGTGKVTGGSISFGGRELVGLGRKQVEDLRGREIGLASRPKLLIADEPTSALDVTVQKKILDHLEGLTAELGTAVLFITHDLGLAAERAEHLVVMYKGRVVESGPAAQILKDPQHEYTKRLVSSAPSLASRRIQSAHERGQEAEDLLAEHADEAETTAPDVVVAKDLTKVFHIRGSRPGTHSDFTAVDSIDFVLPKGRTLALVGESGSGKSTAANMVLGLLDPTSGTVMYDGKDVSKMSAKEQFSLRRRVQPVFQNPYGSLDPTYSIFRSIEEPLILHKVGDRKSREARVRELLDMVSLPQATMRRFPNELSGGQRQRIAIARALALKPEVLVLDEAVSALDVLVQAQILTLLNDLQAELGLSFLFITHDLAVVRQIADLVAVMKDGSIVEHATTDEVFDNPQQEYTRDLLAAIPGASLEIGA